MYFKIVFPKKKDEHPSNEAGCLVEMVGNGGVIDYVSESRVT